MKLRIILTLAAALGVVILTSAAAQVTPDQWGEQIAPGIEYREYDLPDPNNVFVARMDRNVSDVILDSSIAQGQLVSGRESVSSMAARYDDAINYWGQSWGQRNDVVVAINGSYWVKDNPDLPQSGQIQSGWYAKRFDNLAGGSGFVWKLDRNVFIGGCVNHQPDKQFILFTKDNVNYVQVFFDGINTERGSNELVIYTPQYDSQTPTTEEQSVEVLVEMSRPTLVLPSPTGASGIVRAVHTGQGGTMIPFDHIVLSASGSAATGLTENAVPGTQVVISQEITHYEEGCSPPVTTTKDWTKTYASVGGDFVFLKDGAIQVFDQPGAKERHPRTAIAFNDDYIYFIVVDGRDVKNSIGMTIQELAEFALGESIQATWGIAQDGGGSSTMVVNGEVKNDTYCNNYVCNYYVYLPAIQAVGNKGQPVNRTYQRLVPNGMMMVVVKPEVHSDVFMPGDTVTTTVAASLRVGPGTNYESIATISENTSGIVLDNGNGLNGVLAKGVYWWKVSFGSASGWMAQNYLVGENPPTQLNIR